MRLYASWRADSPVAVLRGRTMRQHRSSGMPQIRFRTSNALPVKALATSGSVATASSSWNCARNLRCSGVDPGVTVSRGTILRLAQPYYGASTPAATPRELSLAVAGDRPFKVGASAIACWRSGRS